MSTDPISHPPGPGASSNVPGPPALEKPHIIYVILEGGLVQEVLAVPAGIEVQVIDYDTQGADPQDLDRSPFGGRLCCRATYP